MKPSELIDGQTMILEFTVHGVVHSFHREGKAIWYGAAVAQSVMTEAIGKEMDDNGFPQVLLRPRAADGLCRKLIDTGYPCLVYDPNVT